MKEAVGKRATDPLMEENEHEADPDAFVSEAIGVVMAITDDQSSGFHFSEVVAKLCDGVVMCRQSVGCEDPFVKGDGREALNLVGGMEEDFHEAHHASILDLDAGYAALAGGEGQGQALEQGEIDMDVERGCLKARKPVMHRMEGFFHFGQTLQGLLEVKIRKVVA